MKTTTRLIAAGVLAVGLIVGAATAAPAWEGDTELELVVAVACQEDGTQTATFAASNSSGADAVVVAPGGELFTTGTIIPAEGSVERELVKPGDFVGDVTEAFSVTYPGADDGTFAVTGVTATFAGGCQPPAELGLELEATATCTAVEVIATNTGNVPLELGEPFAGELAPGLSVAAIAPDPSAGTITVDGTDGEAKVTASTTWTLPTEGCEPVDPGDPAPPAAGPTDPGTPAAAPPATRTSLPFTGAGTALLGFLGFAGIGLGIYAQRKAGTAPPRRLDF